MVIEMIKAGYRRSEVGIIPVGWRVVEIGDHIDLLTGFPFPSSHYSNNGIKLLEAWA